MHSRRGGVALGADRRGSPVQRPSRLRARHPSAVRCRSCGPDPRRAFPRPAVRHVRRCDRTNDWSPPNRPLPPSVAAFWSAPSRERARTWCCARRNSRGYRPHADRCVRAARRSGRHGPVPGRRAHPTPGYRDRGRYCAIAPPDPAIHGCAGSAGTRCGTCGETRCRTVGCADPGDIARGSDRR
ncbi:Uncharacterised protein [Mycobacteroides abscessus subsp. abscessus]|nr:Uncharacterised protein [Mycobacteroides abscessus subsp. abscessus]